MRFLFVVCFFLLAIGAWAQQDEQTLTVTGRVMDADSHMPLQFVTLTLQDISTKEIYGDISNKNGEFEVEIPAGKYYFVSESLSFNPYIINILKIDQDYDLGVIELQQNIEELQEIEVYAKDKLIDYQSNKKVYNASKDIANIGGNAITVLENTPSVTVNEEGKIAVRGNSARVLVNGRPFGGSQSNSDILSIIPSSTIQKVELITRSAKYDAEGGEIINIVLKKGKNSGYNGTVEGHIGHPDNTGISAFVNHKTNKVNIFATASYNHLVKLKDVSLNQTYLDNQNTEIAYYDQEREDHNQRNSLLLNFGSEFYLDSLNTITTSLLYTGINKNYDASMFLNDFQPIGNKIQSSHRKSDDDADESLIEAYLNFTKKFKHKNQKLSLHLNYDYSVSNGSNNIVQQNSFPNNDIFYQEIDKGQTYNNYYFKVDYSLPIKENAILELGQKSEFRDYSNDFYQNEYDANHNQVIANPYQNQIDYNENIFAFYANFNRTFDRWGFNLGLRTEFSNTEIVDELNLTNFKNDYTYWLPSATINYNLEDNSSFSLYYAPYITRPTIKELNPFNEFSDERFQQMGNPFLQPYKTDYYLLEYHKDWNKISLSSAVYYTHSKDGILNVIRDTGNQTSNGFPIYRRIPTNLGDIDYYGLELELTYMPSKKFRVYGFFSPFITNLENTENNGAYDYENTVYSAKLMAQYRFTNTLRVQLNGSYQSSLKTAMNELDDIAYLNGTVSKDILDGSATITFRMNDILHTKEFIYKSIEAQTLTNRNAIYDTQYLLSFSYRFNKARRRNSHNRASEVDKNIFEIEEGQ